MPVSLAEIVRFADTALKPENFTDYPGAVNGLQFENNGQVTRIGAAVDASMAVLEKAAARSVDFLMVHHGMFWSPTTPWTGRRARQLRLLVERNLAVYSQHLPLDAHPQFGNAAVLARKLGLNRLKPFFFDGKKPGQFLGWQGRLRTPMTRNQLRARLEAVLQRSVTELAGGGATCGRIGICTGGAGSELAIAHHEGVDTFITGEGPHWTHALAEDLRLNVFYGGHYATETFGVRALAEKMATRFSLPWEFIDHPSGL